MQHFWFWWRSRFSRLTATRWSYSEGWMCVLLLMVETFKLFHKKVLDHPGDPEVEAGQQDLDGRSLLKLTRGFMLSFQEMFCCYGGKKNWSWPECQVGPPGCFGLNHKSTKLFLLYDAIDKTKAPGSQQANFVNCGSSLMETKTKRLWLFKMASLFVFKK